MAFERFADDADVLSSSEAQAREVLAGITDRTTQLGLTLRPNKAGIVYCKDSNRSGRYERTTFTSGKAGRRYSVAESVDWSMTWMVAPPGSR